MNIYQAIFLFVILVVMPVATLAAWRREPLESLRGLACLEAMGVLAAVVILSAGSALHWIFKYLGQ